MRTPTDVSEVLERIVAAHLALVADLRSRDLDPGATTRLPGWSVGHLLTHLARNADSVVRRLDASAAGVVVSQYPGGAEGRAAEIEAGRHRSYPELVDDVEASGAAIAVSAARLSPDAWSFETQPVSGPPQSALTVLHRRVREVVLHHTDLDIGFTPAAWPPAVVDELLAEVLAGVAGRADRSALAGWLVDRGPAPVLAPWG